MKAKKSIKNFILDSFGELIQILFLIACLIFPMIVNLAERIKPFLEIERLTIEDAIYYYLMIFGNWAIGCLIVIYFLFFHIRKSNKKTIYNKGNIYHNKPYWWYWFCSKILGYEKCNLVLVPLYMQYKLILRDTFEDYPFSKSAFPEKKCQINVERKITESNDVSKDINLIIQDTYPISDHQIPSNVKLNTTIVVKRNSSRVGERVYSRELVNSIVEEIRTLNDDIILNIFSTTNPKNTYEIVKNAIALGERGNVKHVYVFQQNSYGERNFDNKPHKVM